LSFAELIQLLRVHASRNQATPTPAPMALALLMALVMGSSGLAAQDPGNTSLAELGQLLFFDNNLSLNRSQSCSSCHDPAKAFSESRDSGVGGAVSLGDDAKTLGRRNSPTLTYASRSGEFRIGTDGLPRGGFFHDGRATSLAVQAGMPILDPTEMAMPDPASVVARIKENQAYIQTFRKLFGESIFDDVDAAYRAMQKSIASYESTDLFAPYDSKYDRYLKGEYQMTEAENLGRILFVSGLTNCRQCHQLDTNSQDSLEPFSSYQYRNIGVPPNPALDAWVREVDTGLMGNPSIDDPSLAGKIKVPTLRNVAVTGPYMHNGVFGDLRTTVSFYNQYLVVSAASTTNPETGERWAAPEHGRNIDLELLRMGQPLDNRQTDAMVAFLATLTDARYEYLLDNEGSN
jgi:cytochrome c peroxidase